MLDIRATQLTLAVLLAGLAAFVAPPIGLALAEISPPGSHPATDSPIGVVAQGENSLAMSRQEGTPTTMRSAQANGDGPDIAKTALLTLAGVGGGAAFFTLAYLIRRRIGFDLHLPPEDGDEPGH